MSKKKIAYVLIALAIGIQFIVLVLMKSTYSNNSFEWSFKFNANNKNIIQVFYSEDNNFTENNSIKIEYENENKEQLMKFKIPISSKTIRLDFGEKSSEIHLSNLKSTYKNMVQSIDIRNSEELELTNNINSIMASNNDLFVSTSDSDPYILIDTKKIIPVEKINSYENHVLLIKKIVTCILSDFLLVLIYIFSNKWLSIPIEIYKNRKLIFYLAKNDFKTKYAGSYFGVFWAFIQPVITVILYWFVFQVGFRSGSVGTVPFVLWLIAGLVPWFFYSDALSSATNSLVEYSYLVKKVVFNVSVLPVVKLLSALFVHIFFIYFMLIVYMLSGFLPSIYAFQIIYYTMCLLVLLMSINYITSSVILFFRDLGQIIGIVLQISMWLTPIMWNSSILPSKILWIFKLNPMFYIVDGYRDSMINNIWFFNKIEETCYFWIFVGGLFIIGMSVFKRLKPHFADVI